MRFSSTLRRWHAKCNSTWRSIFPKENCYRPLGEVSPVIRALATEQFDDYVKRVRVFAHPRLVAELRQLRDLPELLGRAIEQTE